MILLPKLGVKKTKEIIGQLSAYGYSLFIKQL